MQQFSDLRPALKTHGEIFLCQHSDYLLFDVHISIHTCYTHISLSIHLLCLAVTKTCSWIYRQWNVTAMSWKNRHTKCKQGYGWILDFGKGVGFCWILIWNLSDICLTVMGISQIKSHMPNPWTWNLKSVMSNPSPQSGKFLNVKYFTLKSQISIKSNFYQWTLCICHSSINNIIIADIVIFVI